LTPAPDENNTDPAGNAGARIACGEIKKQASALQQSETRWRRTRVSSSRPLFFAVTTEAGPGHSFQSRFGDGPLADFAYPEYAPVDPSQRVFNRPQQVTVALAQISLESRLGLLSPLIRKIS